MYIPHKIRTQNNKTLNNLNIDFNKIDNFKKEINAKSNFAK